MPASECHGSGVGDREGQVGLLPGDEDDLREFVPQLVPEQASLEQPHQSETDVSVDARLADAKRTAEEHRAEIGILHAGIAVEEARGQNAARSPDKMIQRIGEPLECVLDRSERETVQVDAGLVDDDPGCGVSGHAGHARDLRGQIRSGRRSRAATPTALRGQTG